MKFKFRIVREGGMFFIESLTNNRWVPFPRHKKEKFYSPQHAERWLVDNANWELINKRELIKEIEIHPGTHGKTGISYSNPSAKSCRLT